MGTVLGMLRERLRSADVMRVAVLPTFDGDEAYRSRIQDLAGEAAVVTAAGLGEFLETYELADRVLFVDARYMPAGGWSFGRVLTNGTRDHPVQHLVHTGRAAGGLRETVRYDRALNVRSIHRLYDGITALELACVTCSSVPVAAARKLQPTDLGNLTSVRTRLAQTGTPSVDTRGAGVVFDLATEGGLLRANEEAALGATERRKAGTLVQRSPGLWTGAAVVIHPAARVYGPVLAHERAVVAAGAVLIGPAVLGSGARIGREAIVANSVLWPQARVAPRTNVVRHVVGPGAAGDGDGHHNGGRGRRFGNDGQAGGAGAAASARVGTRALNDGAVLATVVEPRGWRTLRSWTAWCYPFAKRAMDLSVGLAGLIAVSPLLAAVAVLVKLTSPGPVLFGHDREGRGGRPFRCWKFRTMVHHAHHRQRELYAQNLVDGPQFKLARDDRITPLGGWLRRTNIDELPQLFNVVRGEMSLIGPRPSPFRENQLCVPWREARLSVRPGITGLWQVCRRDRDAGDFHQWIYYDVLYVRHQSLWLDLRIFLATVVTLAGRWPVPLHWMIPKHRMARRNAVLMEEGR